MAPERFVNALISCGVVSGVNRINLCPGGDQRLDDWKVVGAGFLDSGPYRTSQNRSAVHVLLFKRSFVLDEQLDGFQVSVVGGPMKAPQPGADPRSRIDALGE